MSHCDFSAPENADLNQYWFSGHSIDVLSNAVCKVAEDISSRASRPCTIAFLSTPSLYFTVPPTFRQTSSLFEYDMQWASDPGFVFFDFNEPPLKSQHGKYDLVVIDPPFITHDCWTKYIRIAALLAADRSALCMIATTIPENYHKLRQLLAEHGCRDSHLVVAPFRPRIPNLPYQYSTYVLGPPVDAPVADGAPPAVRCLATHPLWAPNREIDEDGFDPYSVVPRVERSDDSVETTCVISSVRAPAPSELPDTPLAADGPITAAARGVSQALIGARSAVNSTISTLTVIARRSGAVETQPPSLVVERFGPQVRPVLVRVGEAITLLRAAAAALHAQAESVASQPTGCAATATVTYAADAAALAAVAVRAADGIADSLAPWLAALRPDSDGPRHEREHTSLASPSDPAAVRHTARWCAHRDELAAGVRAGTALVKRGRDAEPPPCE